METARSKGWTLAAGDPQAELEAIADELYGPAQNDGTDTGAAA